MPNKKRLIVTSSYEPPNFKGDNIYVFPYKKDDRLWITIMSDEPFNIEGYHRLSFQTVSNKKIVKRTKVHTIKEDHFIVSYRYNKKKLLEELARVNDAEVKEYSLTLYEQILEELKNLRKTIESKALDSKVSSSSL